MIALDVVLVAAVVGGALAYLLWRMRGVRAAPACHPWRRPAAADNNVIVGAALARGVRAARAHGAPRQK